MEAGLYYFRRTCSLKIGIKYKILNKVYHQYLKSPYLIQHALMVCLNVILWHAEAVYKL